MLKRWRAFQFQAKNESANGGRESENEKTLRAESGPGGAVKRSPAAEVGVVDDEGQDVGDHEALAQAGHQVLDDVDVAELAGEVERGLALVGLLGRDELDQRAIDHLLDEPVLALLLAAVLLVEQGLLAHLGLLGTHQAPAIAARPLGSLAHHPVLLAPLGTAGEPHRLARRATLRP